uniref:F-box domain-containing protein n=1 Tax=Mycena chlorophos TaxID=658473 RepID=A0ABQ0LV55_MYCCL|nr:predicted protein [Mycena chlorophos]
MLETLPAELLTEVYRDACTDTGSTGRSLSLVSRYIRATSAPLKYQSLALFGRKQILEFASSLDNLKLPPKTRWLYINGQESQAELDKLKEDWEKREGVHVARARAQQRMVAMADAVVAILRRVAPTLEHLHIALNEHTGAQIGQAGLIDVDLPKLVDLTTCGGGLPLNVVLPPNAPHPLPRFYRCLTLRSLHIVSTRVQGSLVFHPFELSAGLTGFAPDLTHLRLSGFTANEQLILDIADGLGVDPFQLPIQAKTTRTTLQSIVLHPAPPLKIRMRPLDKSDEMNMREAEDDDLIEHCRMLDVIRWLRQRDDCVVLLKTLEEDTLVGGNHYLDEWLHKASGNAWVLDASSIDNVPPEEL